MKKTLLLAAAALCCSTPGYTAALEAGPAATTPREAVARPAPDARQRARGAVQAVTEEAPDPDAKEADAKPAVKTEAASGDQAGVSGGMGLEGKR